MKKLIHNVLWPAAAGNVLWAFLQLLVGDDAPRDWSSLTPRLLALLFIGLYLSRDWIDTERHHCQLKDKYWYADLPMATAIAMFAIALQAGRWWASLALAAAFIVAAVGHLKGAWDEVSKVSQKESRLAFAAINLIGVVVTSVGVIADHDNAWPVFGAIAAVVFLFLGTREQILDKWPARAA